MAIENRIEQSPENKEREEAKTEIRIEDYPATPEGNIDLIIAHGNKDRLDVEDFRDVYGDERVERAREDEVRIIQEHYDRFQKRLDEMVQDIRDLEERARRREEIRKRELFNQKRGEALEALLRNQIENDNWFGEYAYADRTTKYDDLKNGVDGIATFNVEVECLGEERMGLSVDISMNSRAVGKKIERNIKKVMEEGGARVEFFKSDLEGREIKGEVRGIIPVAVGVDGANAAGLFEREAQIIRLERAIKDAQTPNARKALEARYDELSMESANDPVQKAYIMEIRSQLWMFLKMLKKEQPENEALINEVRRLANIFTHILKSKNEEGIKLGDLKNDATYQNIVNTAKDRTVLYLESKE